ncbi:phosphomannomutase/phosphoglucomutase [Nitratireductor basaltis]|uniref:Phosphomannomutase n=1 Tax=Nitratireductor basaltis TaxID=472175 RepID=A0A084UCN2_9HYPH|nr:phosphomannomutase/phosphoglucomutase [Nitratireductor basaltis]KFB10718.1 Phosphomannomutase [Nitratireductor basaltis]
MSAPFKAYDVRGQIPSQINVPFAYRFAQAVKASLDPQRVVVGHDMRVDSPALAQALMQGLMDSGVDVLPVGRCGTEEVYFHTAHSGADAGLMVTASHNPPDYNGIKMVLKGAAAATPENAFNAIEKLVRSDDALPQVTDHADRGAFHDHCNREDYIARLLQEVTSRQLKPLKIVTHAGNGCAGPIIDLLERHLPFTFIKVDHEPDPKLPNGVPNPLLPEKRQKASQAVLDHGADLGIAWDGDFDRCFLYDHKGRFVEGYYLVGMIAKHMLEKEPGSTILYDPRLTWNTIDIVESNGGVAKPCRTGHAYFKQMMREENAIYGGEMSAHHYFRDFSYCDSGMLAWLDVVSELSASGARLADVLEERIAAYPCSGELNFTVDDAKAVQERVAEHFQSANPEVESIDGLGMVFDDWRFNLRASNTEPLLRLNVETRGDKALLEKKVEELRGLIQA